MAPRAHGRGRSGGAPRVRRARRRRRLDARAAALTTTGTLDVAREARARRWTYTLRDGRVVLGDSRVLGAAEPREPDRPAVALGEPLRVALISAADRRTHDGALRALHAGAARIVATLRADDRTTFGEQGASLRDARPDLVIVLAGEQRHGDRIVSLCEAFRAGVARRSPAPRVLVQGDSRTTLRLGAVLAGLAVEVLSDPRRPDGEAALIGRVREFRRATRGSDVLRDEALEALARTLATVASAPATVVDVTGSSTSIVRAQPGGTVVAAHAPDLGVGRAADHVVARAGLDAVRRWIPWAIDAPGLLERVFNRARWPDAVAADPLPLALEIALAHEAIAHVLADADAAGTDVASLRGSPLVALTGRVAELPRGSQSLLVAANGLRPTSLCSVLRDVDDALVTLGALALVHGEASVAPDLEARHEPLALIAPLDAPRAVVRIGAPGAPREEAVERGAFVRVAVTGPLEIATSGASLRGRGIAGPLGLVIDARGHPLPLPPRDAERLPTVLRWYEALGALPGSA